MRDVVHGLCNEEYHRGADYTGYLSSTQLKWYAKSPRYARYMMDHPQEQTDAMRFGSLFHDLMASLADAKGDWEKGYGAWLDGLARFLPPLNPKTGQPYGATTKAYAEAYQQFLADSKGKTVASQAELSLISDMAKSLIVGCGSTSEQVCRLLRWAKETEVSYFHETKEGIRLKVRPDMLTKDKVIDWKTCSLDSFDEDTVARQIIRYGYHISLSMYQWVLHEMTGRWYRPYLVFVSKTPPFDSVVCDISSWCYFFTDGEEPIVGEGVGAQEFQRLLKLHTECVQNGEWPGAESAIKSGNKIMEVSVPWWYEKRYFEE